MKILKRNYKHRNLILFLFLSVIYLQEICLLSRGQSILDYRTLDDFFLEHYVILFFYTIAIFMVLKFKKHSEKILLLVLVMIAGKSFIMLASSFNKMILSLNFIYLLFAFYFFITWELEVLKAAYNPHFFANDLEKEKRFHLKGKLENKESGARYDIIITNMDNESCFVLVLESDLAKEVRQLATLKKGCTLRLEYEGVEFIHQGDIVSAYDRGLGIEFVEKNLPHEQLKWSDLYDVCQQRSFFA